LLIIYFKEFIYAFKHDFSLSYDDVFPYFHSFAQCKHQDYGDEFYVCALEIYVYSKFIFFIYSNVDDDF